MGPAQVVVADWSDLSVRIIDCNDGSVVSTVPDFTGFTRHMAVSPDGKRIAVAADEAIALVDAASIASPVTVSTYTRGQEIRLGIAWTPDGRCLHAVNVNARDWLRAEGPLSLAGTVAESATAKPQATTDGSAVLIGWNGRAGFDEAESPPGSMPVETRSVVIGDVRADRTLAMACASDAHSAIATTWDETSSPARGDVVLLGLPSLDLVARVHLDPAMLTSAVVAPDQDAVFVLDAGDVAGGRNSRVIALAPLDATMAVVDVIDLGGSGSGTREAELARLADGRLATVLRESHSLVVLRTRPSLAIENSFDIGGQPATLAAAPAPRTWRVQRGVSPQTLDDRRSSMASSPFDDDGVPEPAILGDGQTVFYDVTELLGPPVLLRVDKVASRGTVRLSWRDFDASTGRSIDSGRSLVWADPGCHGLGVTPVHVHASLVDSNGDPVGIVEDLEVIPSSVTPARVLKPWRSDPSGTSCSLVSDVTTSVIPEVLVGDVSLTASSPAEFTDLAPNAAISAPDTVTVGETFFVFAVVDGGVQPWTYSWDADSDGLVDGTEEFLEWHYDEPGNKAVTLLASDAQGCFDLATQSIPVR